MMFKKNNRTLYSVVCVLSGKTGTLKTVQYPVALFKNEQKAIECCDFLNGSALPGYYYEIHNLITDL